VASSTSKCAVSGQCFSSVDYSAYENCEFTLSAGLSGQLVFSSFAVENGGPNCYYDYLEIGGTRYCTTGNEPPTTLPISGGSVVRWRTDSMGQRTGFFACLEEEEEVVNEPVDLNTTQTVDLNTTQTVSEGEGGGEGIDVPTEGPSPAPSPAPTEATPAPSPAPTEAPSPAPSSSPTAVATADTTEEAQEPVVVKTAVVVSVAATMEIAGLEIPEGAEEDFAEVVQETLTEIMDPPEGTTLVVTAINGVTVTVADSTRRLQDGLKIDFEFVFTTECDGECDTDELVESVMTVIDDCSENFEEAAADESSGGLASILTEKASEVEALDDVDFSAIAIEEFVKPEASAITKSVDNAEVTMSDGSDGSTNNGIIAPAAKFNLSMLCALVVVAVSYAVGA